MVEPGVRDVGVAETWSDVAIPDLPDLNQWSGPGLAVPSDPQQPTHAPRADRKSRPNRRLRLFGVVRRVWIPLLILMVIGAGSLTVSRLHGVFGSEPPPLYGDGQSRDTTRFDPKQLTYEIFGPPGTLATISYFDADADPQRVTGARLPWSLTFATTSATSVESIAAQGDSDSIGCRILLDGVVKTERTSHEVGAFISCKPKDE